MDDFDWKSAESAPIEVEPGTVFGLYVRKQDAMLRAAAERLNADLFRDGAGLPPPRPLTRRERWRGRWGRACGYFETLWRALKGHDPYEDEGDW